MLIFPCVFIYLSCCNKIPLSAGGCDRRAKRSREEPPHVRGEGWKLGGPHARRAAAKRSYPTSEVRGSSEEYQTVTAQEPPRGATPRPRSGAAARSSYPASEVRGGGQEELPHVPTSPRLRPGRRPGGPTPRPGSSGCVGTGGPTGAIPC